MPITDSELSGSPIPAQASRRTSGQPKTPGVIILGVESITHLAGGLFSGSVLISILAMPFTRIEVTTSQRTELVDVTDRVRSALRKSAIRSGLVHVFSPHTTAGVTIQENADPDVQHDLLLALENAVPARAARGQYQHGEGNSDAHVKTSLTGCSQTVLVENGDLVLGTWQGIYLCEFDGPRHRQLFVKIVADQAQ